LHGPHGQRGPTANGARGKDRPVNGVHRGDTHSSSTPTLPPSLRESERMLFVQQWINTIPPDLPLWVQISLTKIVPITNPEYYPEENDNSSNPDCLVCEGQPQSPNGQHTNRHPGLSKVDHVTGTTQLSNFAPYPVNNHTHSPVGHPSLATAENGKGGLDQNRSAPVGRLFDDMETEMVVKSNSTVFFMCFTSSVLSLPVFRLCHILLN
uniref:BCAS3 n=1 Tax=Echinostoma caproni TaxID=27848 RepID=A0A183ANC4_9TREM